MQDVIIQEIISSERTFLGAEVKAINAVSGGCIHKSWHIELTDGSQLFIKSTSLKNFPMLQFEADCLKTLNNFTNNTYLTIPVPIALKKYHNYSILILPWLNLEQGNQTNLGKGLALLHKQSSEKTSKKFGWDNEGFIGLNIQKSGLSNNWGEVFVNLRLLPQLEIASQKKLIDTKFNKLLDKLTTFLNRHNPKSSLVHGDLWCGNSAINENNQGIIFDPACYWADREVDIAMTKLFGGYSKEFYDGYKEIWPFEKSIETRTDIYNLYHLLNHCNLFGGSYINQTNDLLDKIKTEFESY